MASPRLRYFSFAPLEEKLTTPDTTDTDLAARLGVTRERLRKMRNVGLTIFAADKLACRAGYHPTYFWGDEYFQSMYADQPERGLEYFS